MVATALLRGRLLVAELDAGWRGDPALVSLLPKVTIVVDDADLTPDRSPNPAGWRSCSPTACVAPPRRRGRQDIPITRLTTRPCTPSSASARAALARGTEALLEALTHLDEVEDMRQVARLTVPS